MFTRKFWIATGERTVRTFAQALVAALTADGAGLIDADWGGSLSMSGMAAVLAALTAVGASGAGRRGPGLTEGVDAVR